MKSHPKLHFFQFLKGFTFQYFLLFIFSFTIISQHNNILAQQPTEEWVKRFSWANYANGISIKQDSSGNVYVLMKLYSDSTSGDYGLVKYTNLGNLIWSTYYNNSGNLNDAPISFEVTGDGNVYITGNCSIGSAQRITTVKFNSDGILQWFRVYNGGWPGGDIVSDMAIDKNGNIIITGGTFISSSLSVALAVKYAPNGDTLWVRKYDQISNYSVMMNTITDNLNNVYIAGYYTGSSSDFLVLKYNLNGNLDWYATYNSPQSFTDIADYLALDSTGNLYVLGTTHVPSMLNNNVLVKINSSGITQWSRIFTGILPGQGGCGNPANVVISPDGDKIFYATVCEAQNNTEFVTLLYNSFGDTIWTKSYPIGVTGIPQNNPSALMLDKYNNVYVTGYVNLQGSSDDMLTLKYLPSGIQQWIATYNGPFNSFDYSKSIIIDSNTNLYITGISRRQNMPTIWDAVTIKYSQPLGIINQNNELPREFKLYQNYPNPFNSNTVITYQLPIGSLVKILLYNSIGQLMKEIINRYEEAGYYTEMMNFENFPSGVYFYKISAGSDFVDTKKLIIIK